VQITVEDVHVQGRREALLEQVSLGLGMGEAVLVAGDPGQGHTALALVTTGRLVPTTGRVTLVDDDGTVIESPARLRAVTAVVDLPGISEPEEMLTVRTVVAEGLALARRPSLPGDADRWLTEHRLADRVHDRVDQLEGPVRTALLATLAVEREQVRFIVLALPDRHGGEPSGWWDVARELSSAGYGVLAQCTRSAARDLGADIPPAQGADARRATPREVMRVPAVSAAGHAEAAP